MKVNSKVFRAYDVRGVVGKELSDELIEKLGKAIGTKLKRNNLNSLNIAETADSQDYIYQSYLLKDYFQRDVMSII